MSKDTKYIDQINWTKGLMEVSIKDEQKQKNLEENSQMKALIEEG
eukprot:CAMPEP_0170555126 /NCGR_PEP_ID=MMETSP0211-20121228/13015_1 /TAXON_ID=311385 /ORGANISM="Pseudokeronopsis sp., Strain OXSARD2" /LENGTH=44 /DNA_ID= /DNA_START= /DNA_END= /DNA_ORIENTATION=